jgi:hypothetical protein
VLRKGFLSGYRFQRLAVHGERYADRPEKNRFSHVHDALQYAALAAQEGASSPRVIPRRRPAPADAMAGY